MDSNIVHETIVAPTSYTEEGFHYILHANNSFLLNAIGDKRPRPTYEDLVKLEHRRDKIIPRSYAGSLFVLFSWRSTIFRFILFDFQFWVTIAIYVVDRFFVQSLDLPVSALVIIVGFMSFLLTFYLQNVISRYFAYYDNVCDCVGAIFDATLLIKGSFNEDRGIQLVKYLNAAYMMSFVEQSPGTFSFSNLMEPLNQKYEYLDEVDMAKVRLLRVDGSAVYAREIISWVVDIIHKEVKTGMLSEYRADRVLERVLKLRGSIAALFKFRDRPIPFVYVHFVFFLSAIYMPLFAVLVADNFPDDPYVEVVGVVCVFLNCFFIIGLRDISYRLSDPFGLHDEDLQVLDPIRCATEGSLRFFGSWAAAHIREDTSTGKAVYYKAPSLETSTTGITMKQDV